MLFCFLFVAAFEQLSLQEATFGFLKTFLSTSLATLKELRSTTWEISSTLWKTLDV